MANPNHRDNVFFVSDASFKEDRSAILAVKDMKTGRTKQKIVRTKIQSSLIAEELALRYAIQIAIEQEYRHVIFIYDCLAINTDKFKKRYEKNFKTMQFLWLKRRHIADIDRVTKFEQDPRLTAILDIPEASRDKIIFEILSKYVATQKEIDVFSLYKTKEYKVTRENRTVLLSLLYYLLGKPGKKQLKRYLKDKLDAGELKKVFGKKNSREYHGLTKQLKIEDKFIFDILHLKSQEK